MKDSVKTILITGASSGIGAELARKYAASGKKLILVGRNEARLHKVKRTCQTLGAEVIAKQLDLTYEQEVYAWIQKQFDLTPIDLCILSAGIMQIENEDDIITHQKLFQLNTASMFNIITPLVPLLIKRRRGHIALFSSLRAFNSVPYASAYSASKAAILQYGLGLCALLQKHNIQVSVICPGFVDTPLTKDYIRKPLCVSVETAADIIQKGLAKKKRLIAFPRRIYFLSKLLQILPVGLSQLIIKHI
jgi:short-subunit dehydrogenase